MGRESIRYKILEEAYKEKINQLKEFIENIKKVIDVEKVYLFGSLARGNFRLNSDIDVIIVSNDKKIKNKNLKERLLMLSDYIEYPIDYLVYTEEEIKKLIKTNLFFKTVSKEWKLVYSKDKGFLL